MKNVVNFSSYLLFCLTILESIETRATHKIIVIVITYHQVNHTYVYFFCSFNLEKNKTEFDYIFSLLPKKVKAKFVPVKKKTT